MLLEILGWLKIVISPTLIGALIGGLLYLYYKNETGVYLGVSIAVLGLVVGVIWATNIWKKQGTMNFLSRTNASPELNKTEENNH